jgi:predicted Rossmann-fold nucleotide-binding protein
MPGGFGTLDEFFEVLTLVQTRRITSFPIIAFGRAYWKGLLRWTRTVLEGESLISPGDLKLVQLVDTPEEALRIILDYRRRAGAPEKVAKAFA